MTIIAFSRDGQEAESARDEILPKPPKTRAESGLDLDLLTPLVLKTLYFSGELTGTDIARRLGVFFGVVEESLDGLKAQRHCAVVSSGIVGGPSFRYAITAEGRTAAAHYLQHDHYFGAAPVPLRQYCGYLEAFSRSSLPDRRVSPEAVREAFADLVLSDRVLDEIGPALRGGRSIFIHGAPGNGKTAIAQRLRALLPGDIAIPHAIDVDGHIVRVFDPVAHEPSPPVPGHDDQPLARTAALDARWVLCRRPLVVAGGELTLDALDLVYQAKAGYYRAPVQLLANGGLLLFDDFGRQRASTVDVLNRWMAPLEDGVDYLTLQSGLRFSVPFLSLVVFITNQKPSEIADEAFLRRIRHKVAVEDPTPAQFLEIFEETCRRVDLPFDPRLVEDLIERWYRPRQLPLRGCHPRDLVDRALLRAEYRRQPHRLTRELLESVCANYFTGAPLVDGSEG